VVMFEGRFTYETLREEADIHIIGRHMASSVEEGVQAHA